MSELAKLRAPFCQIPKTKVTEWNRRKASPGLNKHVEDYTNKNTND